MDEDLAKTYVEENLVAGENSTAAAFVEEYLTMNEVAEKFIKEYVISRIRDNLTSIAVSINDFGYLVVTPEYPADYNNDVITIEIDERPFKTIDGYRFELGKIIAPNGTQIILHNSLSSSFYHSTLKLQALHNQRHYHIT
jgi:hypothetical protein